MGKGFFLFQADTLRLGLAGAIEIEHLGVSVQSGLVVLGQGDTLGSLRLVPHRTDLIAAEDRSRDTRRQVVHQRGRRVEPLTHIKRIETTTGAKHQRGIKSRLRRYHIRLGGDQPHLGGTYIRTQCQEVRRNPFRQGNRQLAQLIESHPADLEGENTQQASDRPLLLTDQLIVFQQFTLDRQHTGIKLIDRQLRLRPFPLQLAGQLMGTTGTGQRVPQHLLTPVQADQLIILNRQIGDQHRLGKTGSLHGSHPTSGGGLLLPGQFAPDIRFPLKAQAQAEIPVRVRYMLILRQGRHVRLAIPHTIHRIFTETVHGGSDVQIHVRQQKPLRPPQGRAAHGDALHALPEGMIIA